MNKKFRQLSDSVLCGFRFGVGVALVGLSLSAPAANREFFVAPEGDDVNNDGLSWESPFKTIQRAVDVVQTSDKATLVISNGTYLLDKTITMGPDCGLRLMSLTGDPADVVIDGQNACACLWNTNSMLHLVLSGLTFRNGFSDSPNTEYVGGVYSNQRTYMTNCIVRNCRHVISDNNSGRIYGGGLMLHNQSHRERTVDYWGVPVLVVDTLVENCSLTYAGTKSDRRIYGGGASLTGFNVNRMIVSSCVLTNASGSTYGYTTMGGGAYFSDSIVSNSVFSGNAIRLPNSSGGERGQGGGVCIDGSTSYPGLIVDSRVGDNTGAGSGGGLCLTAYASALRLAVTNNVCNIDGKTSSQAFPGGAGIAVREGRSVVICGCLVAGNSLRSDVADAGYKGGGLTTYECNGVLVADSIFSNNVAQVAGGLNFVNSSSVVVSNCVVTKNVVQTGAASMQVYDRGNCKTLLG